LPTALGGSTSMSTVWLADISEPLATCRLTVLRPPVGRRDFWNPAGAVHGLIFLVSIGSFSSASFSCAAVVRPFLASPFSSSLHSDNYAVPMSARSSSTSSPACRLSPRWLDVVGIRIAASEQQGSARHCGRPFARRRSRMKLTNVTFLIVAGRVGCCLSTRPLAAFG